VLGHGGERPHRLARGEHDLLGRLHPGHVLDEFGVLPEAADHSHGEDEVQYAQCADQEDGGGQQGGHGVVGLLGVVGVNRSSRSSKSSTGSAATTAAPAPTATPVRVGAAAGAARVRTSPVPATASSSRLRTTCAGCSGWSAAPKQWQVTRSPWRSAAATAAVNAASRSPASANPTPSTPGRSSSGGIASSPATTTAASRWAPVVAPVPRSGLIAHPGASRRLAEVNSSKARLLRSLPNAEAANTAASRTRQATRVYTIGCPFPLSGARGGR